jgi:hypothetical protein
MRQNSVDLQNKELRINILALLPAPTRAHRVWKVRTLRTSRRTECSGLVTTRRVTPDDIQRHQEQTAIAPLNQCDGPAATRANILELGKDVGGGGAAQPLLALQTSQAGIDFIVTEEDGGEVYYTKHYQHFEYPGGASGATCGIGYDCGYKTPAQIHKDWDGIISDSQIFYLVAAAGLTAAKAQAYVQANGNAVTITWDQAMAEFMQRELPAQEAGGDEAGVAINRRRPANDLFLWNDGCAPVAKPGGALAARGLVRQWHELQPLPS